MPSLTLADAATRTAPMAKKGWIKKAIKPSHRGAFRAKAEAAGESTKQFAKAHENDSGKTGAQARLATTLMGMNHKRAKLYDRSRKG